MSSPIFSHSLGYLNGAVGIDRPLVNLSLAREYIYTLLTAFVLCSQREGGIPFRVRFLFQ